MNRPAAARSVLLAPSLAGALLALATTAAVPGAARAQTAADAKEADRLGKEGERLLGAHDAAGAIDNLNRAYALSKNARFLLPLGFAYAEAERPLDALDTLGRFLKDTPSLPDAKRKEVGGRIGVMLDQVAALVTLEATRQNAAVKLDGRPLGNTPIETPLRLLPGKHTVEMVPAATDPSSGAKVTVEVKPGERRTIKLEPGARSKFLEPQAQNDAPEAAAQNPEAPIAAVATASPGEEGSSKIYKKWWFWTGIGAVAALGVGLGVGLGTRGGGSGDGTEFPNVPSWPGGPIDTRPTALVTLASVR